MCFVFSEVKMAAAASATFTIGTTQTGRSLPQSSPFGLKFNSQVNFNTFPDVTLNHLSPAKKLVPLCVQLLHQKLKRKTETSPAICSLRHPTK